MKKHLLWVTFTLVLFGCDNFQAIDNTNEIVLRKSESGLTFKAAQLNENSCEDFSVTDRSSVICGKESVALIEAQGSQDASVSYNLRSQKAVDLYYDTPFEQSKSDEMSFTFWGEDATTAIKTRLVENGDKGQYKIDVASLKKMGLSTLTVQVQDQDGTDVEVPQTYLLDRLPNDFTFHEYVSCGGGNIECSTGTSVHIRQIDEFPYYRVIFDYDSNVEEMMVTEADERREIRNDNYRLISLSFDFKKAPQFSQMDVKMKGNNNFKMIEL